MSDYRSRFSRSAPPTLWLATAFVEGRTTPPPLLMEAIGISLIALASLVYLLVAVLRPEKF